MRYGKQTFFMVLALLVVFCGMAAAEQTSPLNAIGYTVEPILPVNQMPGYTATFNLRVIPDEQQIIQALITNSSDQDIDVAVKVGTAFTNENGVIEYGYNLDESLAVDFSSIVVPMEPVIRVPANDQAIAEFVLTVPQEPFRGTVFGGFTFTKLNQDDADTGSAMRIQNVFQYIINARFHESDEEIIPAFELLGAEVDFSRRSPALLLHLRNSEPCIVRQASLRVSIYQVDGGEAVFSANKDFNIAPNSYVPYAVYLSNADKLQPGEYRVELEIEHNGRAWTLEAPLTVQ